MRGRIFGPFAAICLLVPALVPIAGVQAKPRILTAHHPAEPYTAEFKSTQIQTLANGTTITRESTRVQAMDSQGRTVFVNTSMRQFGDHTPMTSVHIDDPVAGTRSDWDSQRKKVTTVRLPPEEQRHGCWRSDNGRLTINYPSER